MHKEWQVISHPTPKIFKFFRNSFRGRSAAARVTTFPSIIHAVLCTALLAGCAGQAQKPQQAGAQRVGGVWHAVIGGMSGVAVGKVITDYMDSQARELSAVTDAQRIDDGIVVTLNDTLLFDFDSADLNDGSRAPLQKLAAVFNKYPKTLLTVTGNTDNVGSLDYNIPLSEHRAKAVADYLVTQGVDADRVRIMGLGFERPLASNDSADGRARNRRVEIHVAPTAELRDEDRRPPGDSGHLLHN